MADNYSDLLEPVQAAPVIDTYADLFDEPVDPVKPTEVAPKIDSYADLFDEPEVAATTPEKHADTGQGFAETLTARVLRGFTEFAHSSVSETLRQTSSLSRYGSWLVPSLKVISGAADVAVGTDDGLGAIASEIDKSKAKAKAEYDPFINEKFKDSFVSRNVLGAGEAVASLLPSVILAPGQSFNRLGSTIASRGVSALLAAAGARDAAREAARVKGVTLSQEKEDLLATIGGAAALVTEKMTGAINSMLTRAAGKKVAEVTAGRVTALSAGKAIALGTGKDIVGEIAQEVPENLTNDVALIAAGLQDRVDWSKYPDIIATSGLLGGGMAAVTIGSEQGDLAKLQKDVIIPELQKIVSETSDDPRLVKANEILAQSDADPSERNDAEFFINKVTGNAHTRLAQLGEAHDPAWVKWDNEMKVWEKTQLAALEAETKANTDADKYAEMDLPALAEAKREAARVAVEQAQDSIKDAPEPPPLPVPKTPQGPTPSNEIIIEAETLLQERGRIAAEIGKAEDPVFKTALTGRLAEIDAELAQTLPAPAVAPEIVTPNAPEPTPAPPVEPPTNQTETVPSVPAPEIAPDIQKTEAPVVEPVESTQLTTKEPPTLAPISEPAPVSPVATDPASSIAPTSESTAPNLNAPIATSEGIADSSVAVSEIATRPELMQFKKSDDSKSGTNESDTITGEWNPLYAGVVTVWEPINPSQYGLAPGERFIIGNGHHRLEKAKQAGVNKFEHVQILREADGYSAGDARTIGAEINIADGKGTVYDQSKFFRNTAATHGADAAMERARQIGARGKKASAIGLLASDSVYDSFINERISPEHAAEIAQAAPNDEAGQGVGLRAALNGKSPAMVGHLIKAWKSNAKGQTSTQLDLLGNDDSAIQAMENQAEIAAKEEATIREQISAVSGAVKKPDVAAKMGVDVKDPASIKVKLTGLRTELARWDNWPMHPDLVARTRGIEAPVKAQPVMEAPLPTLRQGENQGDLLSNQTEDLTLVGETGADTVKDAEEKAKAERETEAEKAKQDAGQGDMFGPQALGPKVIDQSEPGAGSEKKALAKQARQYAIDAGIPAEKQEAAANGISRALSLAADESLARPYTADSTPERQGDQAGVAVQIRDGTDTESEADRRSRELGVSLGSKDLDRVAEALKSSDRVSSIIPRLVSREIPHWNIDGSTIATPGDFAALVQTIRSPYFESIKVAFLDENNQVKHSQILFVGSLRESIAHPRDFIMAMQTAARKTDSRRVIISHNHPSGNPNPSGADKLMQSQWEAIAKEVGIEIIDHVITNGESFYSFRTKSEMLMDGPSTLQPWEVVSRSSLPRMEDLPEFSALIKSLRADAPDAAHLIYVSAKFKVTAVERVPGIVDEISARVLNGKVIEGAAREGAYGFLVDLGGVKSEPETFRIVRSLTGLAQEYQIRLLDVSTKEFESMLAVGVLEEPMSQLFEKKNTPGLKPLKNKGEAGSTTIPEIMVEAAVKFYRIGMKFGEWSKRMVSEFGKAVKPHLNALWRSLSGQNVKPQFRESGAVGGAGKRPGKEGGTEVDGEQTSLDQAANALGGPPPLPKADSGLTAFPIVYSAADRAAREKETTSFSRALEALPASTQRNLAGKTYFAGSNPEDEQIARDYIATHGVETAYRLAKNNSPFGDGLTTAQASMVKAVALKMTQDVANALAQFAASNPNQVTGEMLDNREFLDNVAAIMAHDLSEEATGYAQGLQIFNKIANLFNPKTAASLYTQPIKATQADVLKGDETAKKIEGALDTGRKEGTKTTIDKLSGLLKKVGLKGVKPGEDSDAMQDLFDFMSDVMGGRIKWVTEGSPLPQIEQVKARVVEVISSLLAKQVSENSTPSEGKELPIFDVLLSEVQKLVSEQINAITPTVQSAETPLTLVEQARKIGDLIQRVEMAEGVFNSINAKFGLNATFDPTKVSALAKAVKSFVTMKEEIRKSLSERRVTVANLQGIILENNPTLSTDQREKLAKAIEATYNSEVTDASERALQALITSKEARETRKILNLPTIRKLMDLVNMGAFSKESFYNTIAERYNLPTWNTAQVKQLEAEWQELQKLPEDSNVRNEAAQRLSLKMAKMTSEGEWQAGKWWQKAMHMGRVSSIIWKASILTGVPTQIVNTSMTAVSVASELMMLASGAYMSARLKGASGKDAAGFYFDMLRSLSAVAGNGNRLTDKVNVFRSDAAAEAFSAMTAGTTRFKSEKLEGLMFLENYGMHVPTQKEWEGFNNPVKLARYLGQNYAGFLKLTARAMQAADGFNSLIANNGNLQIMARYEALNSGLKGADLAAYMEALTDKEGTTREWAAAISAQERADGVFGTADGLTGAAALLQNKKINVAERRRVTQLMEHKLYTPEQRDRSRQFSAVATYNSDPTGVFAMVMDGIFGNANRAIGVTAILNPFPRTISNIMNALVNYSPLGFARAEGFSVSRLTAKRISSRAEKYATPKIERGSPEYFAMHTRAAIGTGMLAGLFMMAKGLLDDEEETGKRPFMDFTALGPKDFKKRQQLQLSGLWVPNSVRVGNKSFVYTDWPVLSLILSTVGSYMDDHRYNKGSEKTGLESAQSAAFAIANVLVEKRMLSGMSDLMKVLGNRPGESESALKRLSSSYPSGLMRPGWLRWVEDSFSIGEDGKVGIPDKTGFNAWALSLTPVGKWANKPAINLLGEEIRVLPWEATSRRFVKISDVVTEHKILTPMTLAGLYLPISEVHPKLETGRMKNGKKERRALNGEETYTYKKAYGQFLKEQLTPDMVKRLTDEAGKNKEEVQEFLTSELGAAARNRAEESVRN